MRRWTGSWLLLTAVIAACSSLNDSALPTRGSSSNGTGTGTGNGGSFSLGGPSSSGGTAAVIAPEQEEDQSFRAPVVSGRWVWTANPDTGKVAVVDAKNFTVRLADAGQAPTYLAALPTAAPNTSKALVINAKSQDANLLSAGDTGDVTASNSIPLQANANVWTVSKSGNFAIAWTDSQGIMADPAEGFDDISVLDLRGTAPVATRLVVGFLPSRVFIDDDEQKAFVVASTGITMIDLSVNPPYVTGEKAVSRDIKDDATTRDVSVLPDGSYALVRHDGSATITLVNLDPAKLADATTETLSDVTLPGPVTDLDLNADSTSALAVVRGDPTASDTGDGGPAEAGVGDSEAGASSAGAANTGSTPLQSTLAILPIPQIFSAPTSFVTVSIDQVFGLVNIAPQGTKALLYTNAIANSNITVLETAPGPNYLNHRNVDAHGNVRDVFPSPDGAYAIATLTPQTAADKPGFSVIPVDASLPSNTQTTEAPVFAVAQISSPLARAVITVSDGATNFAAYVVRMPELVVDRVALPSQPLAGATGLVPDAGMAYIAESNPEGRITFIDLETGVPRTITGFEIAAKVIDGN